MQYLLAMTDDVLRRRGWPTERRALPNLVGLIVVFGMVYGAAMGSFGGFRDDRPLQMLYSALKVPLMLAATFAISLPSFFVLNTLLGLRSDFNYALRAVAATQAGLAIILASLAPLTILWYLSSSRYSAAVTFNGVLFAIASFSAQWILRDYYQPLVNKNRRHLIMMRAWAVLYSFVGIQMAWMLRPFVGDPHSEVQFLREDTWGNAYLVVLGLVARMLGF